MKCFYVIVFIVLLQFTAQAQNLVPNPGFEERTECIYNDGSLNDAPPWYNPCTNIFVPATPDVFHECTVVNEEPCPYPEETFLDPWLFGVPTNGVGCESPHEGAGYAGNFFFYQNNSNPDWDGYREYLGVPLIQSMEAGLTYEVSFWISLAERNTHAIWNVQVLFTEDSAYQPTDSYMEYEPQLSGTQGDFIDNYDGWRQLSWQYTAQGGEKYMYIGNFQPNSETDTLFVFEGESTIDHYFPGTYYYIDDVYVGYPTGIVDNLNSTISLWPNPISAVLHINLPDIAGNYTVQILDLTGREFESFTNVKNHLTCNINHLSAGLYLIKVYKDNRLLLTKKIIKL